MRLLAFLLVLLPSLSICHARAFLALDRVINGILVSTRNATITYQIHNIGDGDATQISLKDLSFPSSRFQLYSGTFRHSQDTLSAGDSVYLTAVVAPKRAGELFVTPASVRYTDETGASHVTRLATDETLAVEDVLEYRRRTDRHRKEWAAYGLAFAVLVAGPAMVSMVIEKGLTGVGGGKKKQ